MCMPSYILPALQQRPGQSHKHLILCPEVPGAHQDPQ